MGAFRRLQTRFAGRRSREIPDRNFADAQFVSPPAKARLCRALSHGTVYEIQSFGSYGYLYGRLSGSRRTGRSASSGGAGGTSLRRAKGHWPSAHPWRSRGAMQARVKRRCASVGGAGGRASGGQGPLALCTPWRSRGLCWVSYDVHAELRYCENIHRREIYVRAC